MLAKYDIIPELHDDSSREQNDVHVTWHFCFSSVQWLSRVRLFATPWIAARQASLSITNSWSSLKFTSIESVMPSSHLILCRPLFLLPPIAPSIRVFSNESTLHMRWPKYWCFSFSIIPSKHPGLISFRMDWLDLLAAQGTLKSLLQHQTVTTVFINYLTRVLDTLLSTLPKNGILSILHHRLTCNLSAFRTLYFFCFLNLFILVGG